MKLTVRAVLCALMVVLFVRSADASVRIALVIGNGAYAHAAQLSNPVRDARAIADKLIDLGFDVTYTIDRTKIEMEKALQKFTRAARSADVAVLFYAGHGIQLRGKNYFIPIDAKLTDVDDVNFELVEVTKMVAAVERGANVTLVFLDACRDNPFIENMRGYTRAVGSRGLARIAKPSLGTLVSYAAQPGTVAQDGAGRHSPYTTALLEHLGTPGQSISQTLTRVRRAVYDATDGQQIPQDYNSLLDEYYIVPQRPVSQDEEALARQLADLEAELKRLQEQNETETDVASVDPAAKPETAPVDAMKPGDEFSDCEGCPELVVIPSGAFRIGSPNTEQRRLPHEGPRKKVTLARKFAIGKHEISFGQFKAFVKEAGYNMRSSCWRSPGFLQTDNHPVVCVSWRDAQAYVAWLTDRTGQPYRLPSEAEWEYAARAGTTGMYSIGPRISARTAVYVGWFDGRFSGALPAGDGYGRPLKIHTMKPNKYGLHHVHGNVSEWVQDCYLVDYESLPGDGSATLKDACSIRVHRGGNWNEHPWRLRSAHRDYTSQGVQENTIGFRVVRDLP